MQEIIDSDEFITWFGVLVDLIHRYDLTESEIDPYDFVEPYLDGDSQITVMSLYFNYDLP